jgi:hypothetical protein
MREESYWVDRHKIRSRYDRISFSLHKRVYGRQVGTVPIRGESGAIGEALLYLLHRRRHRSRVKLREHRARPGIYRDATFRHDN